MIQAPFSDWEHTIIMGRTSSICGNCGHKALPSERVHRTIPPGWDIPEFKGCGTLWAYAALDVSFPNYLHRSEKEWCEYTWIGVATGTKHSGFRLVSAQAEAQTVTQESS